MLSNKHLIVGQNYEWKYNIQKIPYSHIKKVEIETPWTNIVSNLLDGIPFYITFKDKQNKKEIHWLKNWQTFKEALEKKWINTFFISPDNIIDNFF